MICILCKAPHVEPFFEKEDDGRGLLTYFHCLNCDVVFLEPSQRLTSDEEKARYDLHENDPDDDGYITFLEKLTKELVPHLRDGAEGLDFGCGPGPAIGKILEPQEFTVHNYDPYFFADDVLLEKQYDFITATEVFEHLYEPAKVLELLKQLLKPSGVLGIMTQLSPAPLTPETFSQWWYHGDETHVCFYSEKTFEWIAREYGFEILDSENSNCIVLKKI